MWRRAGTPFWALVLLLGLCFGLGGSARADVGQLIFLRPLTALLLAVGLWRLRLETIRKHKFLVGMAITVVALPALQLLPLPYEFWSQLPGRGLVASIDHQAGLTGMWRPLTLTPAETRNAFFATLAPLAALALGLQLAPDELFRLLPVMLILGGVSALVGLMQTLGDPYGPLYLYPITNNGAAVGLFANRNHQALLLAAMLPMLAVWGAGLGGAGRLGAWAAMVLLLPLILVTGSRLGLVTAALALVATPLILVNPNKRALPGRPAAASRVSPMLAGVRLWLVIAGLGLFALTALLGRAEAWNRLLTVSPEEDSRWKILPTLVDMIATYMPFGSGMGSFERIYLVHEPDALLSPTYMNHAHDDWLEILLTGGVPALLLLIAATVATVVRARRAWKREGEFQRARHFTRLGLALVVLIATGSVSDYPLRTPAIAVLFIVAVLWAGCTLPQAGPSSAAANDIAT